MVATAGKPIAVISMISYMFTDHTRNSDPQLNNLPVLQEVDKALRAVGAAGRYGALRAAGRERAGVRRSVERRTCARSCARKQPAGDGRAVLDEADSKELLRAYGIAIAARARRRQRRQRRDGRQPHRLSGRAQARRRRRAAQVRHRRRHARDRQRGELRAAYRRLEQNLAKARPGQQLEQVLVAQQMSGGIELVLGVQRDPEVGPVVMFGTGGVLLELHQGRELRRGAAAGMAGAGDDRAHRGRQSAQGLSRRAARRRASVLDALIALGRLAHDLGDGIESIDINPLVALPAGDGAVALDALVVLRDS